MKLKTKLVVLISSFCFVLSTCLFTVFAVKSFNFNIGGSIEFVAPGVEATVSAASLSGISKKIGSGEMSTFTTTRNMSASDIAALDGVKSWTGIALLFDDDSNGKASITFTITNNSTKDTENIMVSLSSNTTSSSVIQATPSADFCIAPGANHTFTIDLAVTNPETSALLNDFSLKVELTAIKTSEISSVSQQQENGLSFTTDSASKTASFTGSRFATSIDIPSVVKDESGIVYTVTEISERAFAGCDEITGELIIPNSIVTIGESAFEDCIRFTGTLVIPNSVKTIGFAAFCGCTGLTGLSLGNGVVTIETSAFSGCTGLSGNLTIPNSVQTIQDNAFYDCTGIDGYVTIGSSVATIGNSAFYNCSNLISITVLATTPPSLSGTYCFDNTGTCKIYVPTGSVEAYKSATYWSEYSSRITAIV